MAELVAFHTQSLRLGLKRLRDSSSTGVRNAGRGCPEIARALREQIDFDEVRERTEASAYGRAFFVIAEGLAIC